MVEERARQGASWPCGASAHRWIVLLCLWVFHVCEASATVHLPRVVSMASFHGMPTALSARVCIAKITPPPPPHGRLKPKKLCSFHASA